MDQLGPELYPKVSKYSQKGTRRRQDCTQGSQMEPKESPKASKCVKTASKVSKVKPKAIHMEPKGPPRRPKWRPKCANGAYKMMICGQVSDSYWFWIDWGSYFWAFWAQIPSIIASKTDAKINAEKVAEISCETVLKSMRNLLIFIKNYWKTMDISMIFNNM